MVRDGAVESRAPTQLNRGEDADGAQLLGVALILAFALRQDESRCRRLVRGATLAERRRIAGDLHDGLAQDLAFIASYAAGLAPDETEHPIAVAARRALAVTRGVIADLDDPGSTSFTDALLAVAHELGLRFDMAITVDAPDDLRVSGTTQQDLVRIVREAIVNAARHGEAGRIVIHAERTFDGLELRVRDDGRGIIDGSGVAAREGFGITSMRDRAAAIGGQLTVARPAGGGTEVIVRIQ